MKKKQEKLFIVVAMGLVIAVLYYNPVENNYLNLLLAGFSEVDWDEVKPRNIVENSIPITLIEKMNGKCKVTAYKFDYIIDHEYFIRQNELASQLNYDRENETLMLSCDLLEGEKSRLNVWYVLEESPKHATRYEYFITPWEQTVEIRFNGDKKTYKLTLFGTVGYNELRYATEENAIVVYPAFTEFAYKDNGFYSYYRNECDENCLTVKISDDFTLGYTSSKNGFLLLQFLGYPYVTDIEIAKNPDVLKSYDKVILLHSEYVTRAMFEAITNHPHVIYLYPNALYAEVEFSEENDTITLIRGHGYPDQSISNGFDWKYDNTHPYEFDTDCEDWKFSEIDNGYMLNCYPEHIIAEKLDIVRVMKEL